jgi:TonB family protein
MAKPLRSEDPNPPSVQFRDFGVLNNGTQSKGATITSIMVNVTLAALMIFLGYVVKENPTVARTVASITLPPEPPPPPKPVPPPPKFLPPTPTKPPVQPPRITRPQPVVPPPPDLKPLPTPQPKPINLPPAPPKRVNPPPAPVKVNLGVASAASVPNHDEHPSAVRLGSPTNPLRPLTGPAVSSVNLGVAGMPGMNRGNTGNGPRATSVNLGSGCPNCTDLNGHDNGVGPVKGVKLGSGTGPITSRNYAAVEPVRLGTPPPPPAATHSIAATALSAATPPKVTYKPTPVYSEEAKEQHIQGDAVVKVIFRADGAMDVIGLVSGLGHGLDQPALEAAKGVRFHPALDAEGHPIDFPTNIIVHFIINN